MNKRTFTVQTEAELERCFPVMKELRPHLTLEEYRATYSQAHAANDYQIIVVEQENQIVALMGYRFLTDYVRGRHLYIDDLVTTEKVRSQGIGAELLQLAEDLAREDGCKSLRLSTGVENLRGIKFYEANGWTNRGLAFVKKTNI
jgi:ribosomal protein S18 acetylase RimI-like enzyme